MRSDVTGEFYLIEINPRFPSWCYLSAVAGQNMAWALVQLALGRTVPAFDGYQVGAMTLRQVMDIACPMSNFQQLVQRGESDPRFQDDIGLRQIGTLGIGKERS
jgi:carbamoyl-phosphate synthase large subunit